MGRDSAIGHAGGLPWPRLPADMARFRRLTAGLPVIMGRLTWDGLPIRPLPGRYNVVMSRYRENIRRVAGDVDREGSRSLGLAVGWNDALAMAECYASRMDRPNPDPEVVVIGGASIYRQALAEAHAIHLTLVAAEFPAADTHFPGGVPDWSEAGPWREVASEHRPADAANPLAMEFVTLERRAVG